MTKADLEAHLHEVWSREQIRQAMARYCRGCDRCDKEMILSAYHPDALDEHGAFKGTAAEFADWADDLHKTQFERTAHVIANHLVEFDPNDPLVAYGETYVVGYMRSSTHDMTAIARYLDRFECRNNDWRIAHRQVVVDWVRTDPIGALSDVALADTPSAAQRSSQDPSYKLFAQIAG